jgi:hypothetical protein
MEGGHNVCGSTRDSKTNTKRKSRQKRRSIASNSREIRGNLGPLRRHRSFVENALGYMGQCVELKGSILSRI